MEASKETRILIRGINWSGSGTVVDLLREYKRIIQIPGGASEVAPAGYIKFHELRDYNIKGGIKDVLANEITVEQIENLRKYIVIRKKKLIKDIIRNFKAAKGFHNKMEALSEFPLMWRLIKCTKSFCESLELKSPQEKRIDLAKEWVQNIINETKRNQILTGAVFDQTVDLGQTMEVWSKIFEPYKLIMVHRNPYDQLAEQVNKKYYLKAGTIKTLTEKYGNDPISFIRYFAENTANHQKSIENILDFLPSENVLLLKFEDIILNYDSTKTKIESFLSLKVEDHIEPRKYLKPDWSKNNIGLYDKSNYNFPEDLMMPLLRWYEAH